MRACLESQTVMAPVFISFRAHEALEVAIELRNALKKEGIDAFVFDDPLPGDNGKEIVDEAIDNCELAIILGTPEYGYKTDCGFSSYYELKKIIKDKKNRFFVYMGTKMVQYASLLDDDWYFNWSTWPQEKEAIESQGNKNKVPVLPHDIVRLIKKKLERIRQREYEDKQSHPPTSLATPSPVGAIAFFSLRLGLEHSRFLSFTVDDDAKENVVTKMLLANLMKMRRISFFVLHISFAVGSVAFMFPFAFESAL